MNQKIKSILFVTLVVLSVSALAGVTLADQITGTLTTGTNSSNATGTLTTGLSNGVSGIVMVLPTANPVAGTYTSAQSVILTASGASSINYTLDGSTPTCSTGNVYSNPIAVGASETIQTVSCYPDNNTSAIASFAYVINIPSSGGGGGGGGGGTVVSSGGGGGGGGGYIAPISTPTVTTTTSSVPTQGIVLGASTTNTVALSQLLNSLIAQLQTLLHQAQAKGLALTPAETAELNAGVTTAMPSTIANNLTIGSKGTEVSALQAFLISQAKGPSASALSASGATGYFGSLTKAALAEYQKSVGITPASGYFGAITRAYLKSAGF